MAGRRVIVIGDGQQVKSVCVEKGYGDHFQDWMATRGIRLSRSEPDPRGDCYLVLDSLSIEAVEAAYVSWQGRPDDNS